MKSEGSFKFEMSLVWHFEHEIWITDFNLVTGLESGVYLFEANIISILSEASSTHVEAIFSD